MQTIRWSHILEVCTLTKCPDFQLFDEDNYINRNPMKYLFSTEGHLLPLDHNQFRKPWDSEEARPASANVTDTVGGSSLIYASDVTIEVTIELPCYH